MGAEPAAAAAFLRAQAPRLDKAALGEVLGHHEEWHVEVRVHGLDWCLDCS